jgi:serine/threonine protein kinase, bacterial
VPVADFAIRRLTEPHIDCAPEEHLRAAGEVFAVFDRQDSGNVSYGVAAGGRRYFVKTAGRPDDDRRQLSHAQRVTVLRNAIRLGRTYRHPSLPPLEHVIESPHGPALVYQWRDGELLGVPHERRDDPASPWFRFRHLPVDRVLAVLDTVVAVHELLTGGGEVAGDFYDGCLLYDFAGHRLSLVDLDHYRPGPFRNTSGRMLGSTRFMAPEEFVAGALIDERTTVFTLGRTALLLLGDGTGLRGPAALLDVAIRACRPDPERRHRTVAEFADDWRRARGSA